MKRGYFRELRDRRIYNRAIKLLYDRESYWFLAQNEMPKIAAHHANRNNNATGPLEKGVTGMYDDGNV